MRLKKLLEVKLITTYHGDNFGTKKLSPKLMNNGNNQEGIGIYFGSLKTAETYGTNIVKAEINSKNFIDSRKDIIDFIKIKQIENMLIDMWKSDEETMYYMITDWIEVSEPENITISDIKYLADKMKYDEVRNFQTTLAEQFGVVNFVESWNKHCKNIYGTYQVQSPSETWYCIINTKIEITQI